MLTRRSFLRTTAIIGAGGILTWKLGLRNAFAFYQSNGLQKFAQPLRGVGPGGIPVAAPDAGVAPVTKVTHYSLNIAQFTDQLHPNLGPTTLWGYNPALPLGGGRNPRGTSAASSWRNAERRSRSRLRTRCQRSTSCRSTPPSLMGSSTRTRPLRTCMVDSYPGSATAAHLPGLPQMASTARA
jgi:hypothetical protein